MPSSRKTKPTLARLTAGKHPLLHRWCLAAAVGTLTFAGTSERFAPALHAAPLRATDAPDRPAEPVDTAARPVRELFQPLVAPPASTPSVPTPAPKRAPRAPRRAPNGLYTVDRQGTGVIFRKGMVLGVGVNVIEADMRNPEVKIGVVVAQGRIGKTEAFKSMVKRARPAAAITGTFFGLKNRLPTGDLVVNGRSLFRGFIGTAVAITEGNVVSFIKTGYKDPTLDWSLYETVIRGGPHLLQDGECMVAPKSEGFRTLSANARRTRTAIGITADSRLLLVAVRQSITLWELTKVMKQLGAYHAVALDGGTSTAMYFAGQHVANPGRQLTNVMVLYAHKERYESARNRFFHQAAFNAKPKRAVQVPQTVAPGAPARVIDGFEPAMIDPTVAPMPGVPAERPQRPPMMAPDAPAS